VLWEYEECTGMKLDVACHMADLLQAKLVENAYDFDAHLHITWATDGPVGEPDNRALGFRFLLIVS
jgi:hypothetical protein